MLKKFIQTALLLVVLCTTVTSYAQVGQAPDGIQFQALATDASGHPAAGRVIYVKNAIVAKTAIGTIVYSETFKVTASSAGIFSIIIGKGTYASGVTNIANIDWSNGPFFLNLKVAVEPSVPNAGWNVNNEYVDMGTSQFWSTPYALYAGSVKGMDTKLNIADTAAMLKPYFTAINLKANIESPTFTGTVKGITKTMVGLGNVDNTSDLDKPVSTATQAYIASQIASNLTLATVADASTITKGKIQLAGDLGGTADAPSVPGLLLKASIADVTAALALKADTADIRTYINSQLAAGVSLTTGVTGVLPVTKGGTGQTTFTDGQLLIGNTAGNTLSKSTLTAGSGISITNGNGSITIASTAGSSSTVSGTTNYLSKFINNNTLGNSIISDNGNGVGIGTRTPSGLLHVYGAAAEAVDQVEGSVPNNVLVIPGNMSWSGTQMWQSFTPGTTANLTKIKIWGQSGSNITLKLYSGVGTSGTLLHTSSPKTVTNLVGGELITYDISTLGVVAGNRYTFELTAPTQFVIIGVTTKTKTAESSAVNPVIGSLNTYSAGIWFATFVAGSEKNLLFNGDLSVGSVTYPSAHGTAGQVLTSAGSGKLSWTAGGTSLSVGTITSTSNANGASITSGVLNLTPANATNGGVVTTGTQSFAGNKTILGSLNVSTLNSGEVTDIDNLVSAAATVGATHWQSFTAGTSGALSKITVKGNGASAARNGTFRIYAGTGNTGTLLSTQSVPLPTGSVVWDLVLSSPLNITAGQVYTFEILEPLGDGYSYVASNRIVGSSYYTNAYGLNPGFGGINFGLAFKTWVSGATGGSLTTAGNITAGTVTYPSAHGNSGQVLTTTGSGTLTWTAGGTSLSVGTITSTSNANGATFNAGVLNLTPADDSNGGVVTTGTQSFAGNKTIRGSLNVSTLNSGESVDINNPSTSGTSLAGATHWQSFTAGTSGALTKITVYGGIPAAARNGTLNIYTGTGNAGTRLLTQTVALPTNGGGFPTPAWDLVLTTPLIITAGQVYTFEILDPSSVDVFGPTLVVTNPRLPGTSSYSTILGLNFSNSGTTFGLAFKTWVSGTTGGSITTAGNITAGTVTYPSAHGNSGQVLTTTGSGTLTWTAGGTSLSVGTITSTSNANGASITSGVLNLTPANATNGGVVTTGTQSFAGNKTILGTLNVSTNSTEATTDIDNFTRVAGAPGTIHWQSFTAGTSGSLSKITVYFGNIVSARNGTFKIYAGTGNTGSILSTQTIALPTMGGAFDFLLTSPLNITAGQVYTFEIVDNTNSGGYGIANRIAGSSYYTDAYGLNPVFGVINYGLAFKTWVNGVTGGSITTAGNISAGSTLTAGSVTYPSAHGNSGQVLMTTGSGTLTWTAGGTSLSVGTITSTSNVNGASVTSGVLNLAPANANNGGVVTTGTQSFAGNKTFLGTLNVSEFVNTNEVTDIDNFTQGQAVNLYGVTQWQSFTAGTTGVLTKITIRGEFGAARNGNLKIYSGTGNYNNSNILINQEVALPIGSNVKDLVLTTSLNVTAGQVYTIQIVDGVQSEFFRLARFSNAERLPGTSYYTSDGNRLNYGTAGLAFQTWIRTSGVTGGSLIAAGSITAGSTLTAGSVTYPSTHGTAGQVLSTTGSGTLTWTAASSGSSEAHYIGEQFGGGTVFYVYDGGKHGLIAATVDQEQLVMWESVEFRVLNSVRDGINSGAINTERIIDLNGPGLYAAQLCADYIGGGFGDWYLPSKYELNLLYTQSAFFPDGFSDSYWSSTEINANNTWAQSFIDGIQSVTTKNSRRAVRAIRAF